MTIEKLTGGFVTTPQKMPESWLGGIMVIKLLELPTEPLLRMGKTKRRRPALDGYVACDLTSQFSSCIDSLSLSLSCCCCCYCRNTWNHEHIALLGRALTSPEKDGHRIARHLADYVLIWAGGGGDDLAKSPHLIRIANSVYRGLCKEPTCRTFGMMVCEI